MGRPSPVSRQGGSRLGALAAVMVLAVGCAAQELEPRAYSVSPVGTNFLVLAFVRSAGDISFDPALPVEDATATLHVTALGYGRAIRFAGRSASFAVQGSYLWGPLQGIVYGAPQQVSRSGLMDPLFRFSVNLHGAPAMDLTQFRDYRQKTNIGASLVVAAPLGQYDPAKLLNISSNRWAAKPEVGFSRRLGRWYLDLYLGAWLFTPNRNFHGVVRSQAPIGSMQAHVSYNLTRRLWASFDANFYAGGRTTVDGIRNTDLQRNSRIGATVSIPVGKHQSVKFNASSGAVTNIGAAFASVGVAYQYLWGAGW